MFFVNRVTNYCNSLPDELVTQVVLAVLLLDRVLPTLLVDPFLLGVRLYEI